MYLGHGWEGAGEGKRVGREIPWCGGIMTLCTFREEGRGRSTAHARESDATNHAPVFCFPPVVSSTHDAANYRP